MESSGSTEENVLDGGNCLVRDVSKEIDNTGDDQSKDSLEAEDLSLAVKPSVLEPISSPSEKYDSSNNSVGSAPDFGPEKCFNQPDDDAEHSKSLVRGFSNDVNMKETLFAVKSANVPVAVGSRSGSSFELSVPASCEQPVAYSVQAAGQCNSMVREGGLSEHMTPPESKQVLDTAKQTSKACFVQKASFDSSFRNNKTLASRTKMPPAYDDDDQCEAIDFSKPSAMKSRITEPSRSMEELLKLDVKTSSSSINDTSVVSQRSLTSESCTALAKSNSSAGISSKAKQDYDQECASDATDSSLSKNDECDSSNECCIETPEEMGFPDFLKGIVTIGNCVSVKGDFTLKSSKALIESPSLVTPFLLKEPDIFPEKKTEEEMKCESKEFFKSSVGEFLIGLGFSRVNEWYQRDMMLRKLRQAKKEGQSDGLNQEVEKFKCGYLEAKKANEPFAFSYKKCSFCGFITESDIVFESHLLAPHVTRFREYVCNYCSYLHRDPKEVLKHMKSAHNKVGFIQPSTPWLDCPYCNYETNSKVKLNTHLTKCSKCHNPATNQAPPRDFEFPCLTPKPITVAVVKAYEKSLSDAQKNRRSKKFDMQSDFVHRNVQLPLGQKHSKSFPVPSSEGLSNNQAYLSGTSKIAPHSGMDTTFSSSVPFGQNSNQYYQALNSSNQSLRAASSPMAFPCFASAKDQSKTSFNRFSSSHQPLCRDFTDMPSGLPQPPRLQGPYSGQWNKTMPSPNSQFQPASLVVCEICDGYIKDMEQLRTHMQLIHKVKIHPKMLVSRPPLNCQKCQWRFFTDQGLERHLLGAHGLVTSNMQDLANKGKDSGCCTICGRIFATKLVSHMTQSHKVTLKPAHLSYKCTVCSATFNLYRLFENHVYLVHSGAAKRSIGTTDDISGSCKKFKSSSMCDRENYVKSIPEKENGIS